MEIAKDRRVNYCHRARDEHACDVGTRRGRVSEFYELAPPRIRCATSNSLASAPRIRGGATVASDLRSAPA
jgi:hypothetical protein